MQNNRRLKLLSLLVFALLEGLTHFGAWWGDSNGYVGITHFFMGTATEKELAAIFSWHGFLRPIVPLLAAPLAFLVDAQRAIGIINLLFLLVGTIFTFLLVSRLLDNELLGFIAGIMYASATPNLIWGLAVLTDGPAYAMLAVGYYWLIYKFQSNLKSSIITGLLLSLSLLVKETTIILIAFLVIQWIFTSRKSWIYYFLPIIIAGIAIATWTLLGKSSYFGFFNIGIQFAGGYSSPLLQPKAFMFSIIRAFYVLLPFVCIGLFRLSSRQVRVHLKIIVSGLALLIPWSSMPDARYTFILFPGVISMAALGVYHVSEVLPTWFRFVSEKQWISLMTIGIAVCMNVIAFHYFILPK